MNSKQEMTPEQWLTRGELGKASYTIWAVMMGVARPGDDLSWEYDLPSDPSDFGRCWRLLRRFPEWRGRLSEVAEIFPLWRPMVSSWDQLTTLYEKERRNEDLKAPELFRQLQDLRDQGMIACGLVKVNQQWDTEDRVEMRNASQGRLGSNQMKLDVFYKS